MDDKGLVVSLGDNRQHRVNVEESDQLYQLRAIVLGKAMMEKAAISPARIWEMNRSLTLVGFRIDSRSRLVGEATIPKLGITAAEFQAIVRNLAAECDRYEYTLSGRDHE